MSDVASATPAQAAAPANGVLGSRSLRDWRLVTLVPVVAIHSVAFALLGVLLYRLAVREVVETDRVAAEARMEELHDSFRSVKIAHTLLSGREKVQAFASHRRISQVVIYGRSGEVIAASRSQPTALDRADVAEALRRGMASTVWTERTDRGFLLSGVRLIRNEDICRPCHIGEGPLLGAIQLSLDLTEPMLATRKRLRLEIGGIFLLWAGLVLAMSRLRASVIERPLARIGRALERASPGAGAGTRRDLGELAERLDRTIHEMLDRQRRRETEVSPGLARAEQLAAVGELAASLTHEIRNPIAGVGAAVQVLKLEEEARNGAGSERAQVCGQILSELARVNGTLEGLLRLSRPRPPVIEAVDMRKVAGDVVRLFTPRARGRHVELLLSAEPVPVLPLDPGMMTQLVLNLLANSLQATESGGRIEVLVGPFPKGDGVVVAVSDTGAGIAPEDLPRVLEPFFTTKEHGTGLGLSICRQVVELHGGTLNIESESGKGTRAVVLLPDRRRGVRTKEDGADPAR